MSGAENVKVTVGWQQTKKTRPNSGRNGRKGGKTKDNGMKASIALWEEQHLQLPHHPNIPAAPPTFRNTLSARIPESVKLEALLGSYLSRSGSVCNGLLHVHGVTVACRPIRDNPQLSILSQFCACCSLFCIGSVLGTFSSPEKVLIRLHAHDPLL